MVKLELRKEAERLHRIEHKIKNPNSRIKRASAKHIHLTYRDKRKSILAKLIYLYGEDNAYFMLERIESRIKDFRNKKPRRTKIKDAYFNPLNRFTQKDVILITYPDAIIEPGALPLRTLRNFTNKYFKGIINTIHILPFFPYSSDRGFSVINYTKVKESFGTWKDIDKIGENFNLMIDGVFNHKSSQSKWFKRFLEGNPKYANHFIAFKSKNAVPPDAMKKIVRPRTSDLLTPFNSVFGKLYLWTTFGKDQVDLNYKEPVVLLRIIDIMLRYVSHGATLIRLDAINYIWKQVGTSCVHLKQTHTIIQLLRDILDIAAPSVSLVTETNVSHAQNIKYFGNGRNEAQMVYNFALPPLLLHAFYSGNVKYLSRWADRLENISDYCTFFNFISSHDGIGLMPAKRTLPKKEVEFLIKKAKERGSLVRYRSRGNGLKEPYELNITGWDALNNNVKDRTYIKVRRYIASKAIVLSLKGVPAVYFNSLFASHGDFKAVMKTKNFRDVNRKRFKLEELEKSMASDSVVKQVFERLLHLIALRAKQKAFHPNADQQVLMDNHSVFSIIRTSPDKSEKVLVLVNVTDKDQEYHIDCDSIGLRSSSLYDMTHKKRLLRANPRIEVDKFTILLRPYAVKWIKSKPKSASK